MATAKSTFMNFGFDKICEKYRSNLKEHTHKPLELLNDYQDFDKKIRKMNMELLSLNSKTMKLPVFSSPQTSDKKLKTLHKCKKICNSKHQMKAKNQLWLFKKVMSLYEKFHQIIEQSCSEYHALRAMSESYKLLFNRERKVKNKMPNDLTIHSGLIENISIGVGEFSIRRKDMGSQADFPMIELSDNSTSYSDAENERETDFQRTLEHLLLHRDSIIL
ncbi:uncharacterized protein LOC106648141 [Trichogramma pretiosum]|uniref:uncharacterized protein LOC106648141 n=1 Tax=Trichogramma pretiosum TaxID=7493 RepID=UPI000C71B579|nr:uncharacterized protein LOC106648141 [Trichogramma pretiosum]